MSNYSLLERKIAEILSKFPCLKLFVKKNYQRINILLYKKEYTHKCKFDVEEVSYKGEESFFGYYDKSPINKSNTHIIFHSVSFSTKQMPEIEKGISIVLYDIKQDTYRKIDNSYAYNWQQGTKLMWINNNQFIYNNFDKNNKKYISKIYNIESQVFKTINSPIYEASSDFGISLNFERLKIGRGDYAYNNLKQNINWNDNTSDGLYYIDFERDEKILIVTLEQVIQNNFKDTMEGAKHKFNHVMLSPDKEKIMFMHRWFTANGQRFDSLYVSSIKGDDLKLIADGGMVSHCCWKNNNEVIAYLRDKNKGDKFFLIDVDKGEKGLLGNGQLDKFGDGHPSYNNGNMIFDTYPDKSRMKDLYLFEIESKKLNKLGEFYESLEYYAETRCDLHPRFSNDGRLVFFDTVHTGVRRLNYISIE